MTSSDNSWPTVEELLDMLGLEANEDLSDGHTRPQADGLERVARVLADQTGEAADGSKGEDDPDPRQDVFDVSALLAEVAVGRLKAEDESWDDVVQLIESNDQPSLASALWVGLAQEPEARYSSRKQWLRAVETGIRSDAATADMLARQSKEGGRGRSLAVIGAVAVIAALGVAGWTIFASDSASSESSDQTLEADSEGTAERPQAEVDPDSPVLDQADESDDADTSPAEDEPVESAAEQDDTCQIVGQLGPLFVDQVTDGAIVIGWEPSLDAVNIWLDGGFVDTVPPDTNQYVIEHRPLLPPPLPSGTDFKVEIVAENRSDDAGNDSANVLSSACATTATDPLPDDQRPIGVYAPTGVEILDESSTSLTVGWDLRLGADSHNLFLDGAYVSYGDGVGSTAIGDEREFTFLDLDPGTTYVIGVRRVEGFNQSSMATITGSTP